MKYLKTYQQINEDWPSMQVDTLLVPKSKTSLRQRLIQGATEEEPEEVTLEGTLSGKEIMEATPSGYYYHGSHMPDLTKETVRLFSRADTIGNADIGDRYGFYITSDVSNAYQYSFTWVTGGASAERLLPEGQAIVTAMREASLVKEAELLEDNRYSAPYSLIEQFAKQWEMSNSNLYKLRSGELEHWPLFAILAGVKRGFWPSIYRVKLRPQDRYLPELDLDITGDEAAEYTRNGAVGIYNGKLGGSSIDKRDEIAILNRNAIASMERADAKTFLEGRRRFWKSGAGGDKEHAMWEFSKQLLKKYPEY
tara:strand:- start:10280 stop:11206 length:927 start_codon:yes stop_codon:yes gene_type:complete